MSSEVNVPDEAVEAAEHAVEAAAPAIRSRERQRVREALLSDEAIDEVADEFTEGDEGLHPGFVRSIVYTLFRTIAFVALEDPEQPALSEDEGERCNRCGRACTVWFASSPLWNAVIRSGSIDGDPKYGDMVCATCFMQLAEEQGIASHFRVSAEQVNVELETTTPSGRTWDEDRQLWVDPALSEGVGSGADAGCPQAAQGRRKLTFEFARSEVLALLSNTELAMESEEVQTGIADSCAVSQLRSALSEFDAKSPDCQPEKGGEG